MLIFLLEWTVFADCSAWHVGIKQGRGWHAVVAEPRNVLVRCRRSEFDGNRAIHSAAVARADLDRSLRRPGEVGP